MAKPNNPGDTNITDDMYNFEMPGPVEEDNHIGYDGLLKSSSKPTFGVEESPVTTTEGVTTTTSTNIGGEGGTSIGPGTVTEGVIKDSPKVGLPGAEGTEGVVPGVVPGGKQGVLSKLTHGAIDGAGSVGKKVGKGIKKYFSPSTYKNAWNGATSKISKGLNIKKGVANVALASMIGGAGIAGYVGVNDMIQTKKSDMIIESGDYIHRCVVTNSEEEEETGGGGGGGDDLHAKQVHNMSIIIDVLTEAGYSEDFIIACGSCWMTESGIQSDRLESDFACKSEADNTKKSFGSGDSESEWYGPVADGPTGATLYKAYGNGPYSSSGSTLNSGYYVGSDVCPGIGLIQWTAGRGLDLVEKVDAIQEAGYEYSALDLQYQLGYLLSEWNTTYASHFQADGGDWSGNTDIMSMTAFCFRYMEFGGGTPPSDLTQKRQANIPAVTSLYEEASALSDFTGDIMDMGSILADADISGSAEKVFDPVMCMTTAHNTLDTIPDMAYSLSYVTPMDYTNWKHASIVGGDSNLTGYTELANREDAPRIITINDWPIKKGGNTCYRAVTEYYRLAHYLVCNGVGPTGEIRTTGSPVVVPINDASKQGTLTEDGYLSSCDRTTATIVRAAGADDRFALGDPEMQVDYIYNQGPSDLMHIDGEDKRYAGGGDKDGPIEDVNKLWDAVGVINGTGDGKSFYYPYSLSPAIQPGSIFISGGTCGHGSAGGDSPAGSSNDNYYGLDARIGNNFWNVSNGTTRHIMTYSGSKALQKRYGETLLKEYLIAVGRKGEGTLPNSATCNAPGGSDYTSLMVDDITMGISDYMSDGNSNKGHVAAKADDKYHTFYTVMDTTDDDGNDLPYNDKTGLMTFKSRSEIYCDIVEKLNSDTSTYTLNPSLGFVYNNDSTTVFDAKELTGIEHPRSWPYWKIERYADISYRFQQMTRFSAASQFVSIPAEDDTNIYRLGEDSYYVYAYGYKDSTYEDVLHFDEDTCKTLYNDGSGAWYYDQVFTYDNMVSNDMLQDLIQLYVARDESCYSDDTYSIVSSIDKESVEKIDGKLLIGPGFYSSTGEADNFYGLTRPDWQLVMDYFNDPALCDISEMEDNYTKTYIQWFYKAIELRKPTDDAFEFDLKDPTKGLLVAQNLSKTDSDHKISETDWQWLSEYMYLHYYDHSSRRNLGSKPWQATDYTDTYYWAVYHDDGTPFTSVDELAAWYSDQGDTGKQYLENITVGPTTIPLTTAYSQAYSNSGCAYAKDFAQVPDWFKNRVINPYKLLDNDTQKAINTDAPVKSSKYDGTAFSYTLSIDCSGNVTFDIQNLDDHIAEVKERGLQHYSITIGVVNPEDPSKANTYTLTDGYEANLESELPGLLFHKECTQCKNCTSCGCVTPTTSCSCPSDPVVDTIYLYLQDAASSDGNKGESEFYLHDSDALGLLGNLDKLDAADLPEYFLVNNPSIAYDTSVHEAKNAVIIDSNFNPYSYSSGTYEDPTADDFILNTVDFIQYNEAYDMGAQSRFKIFGNSSDILIKGAVPTDYDHNQSDAGSILPETGPTLINKYTSNKVGGACFILQLCGAWTDKYGSDDYPQHIVYSGMGGVSGTYASSGEESVLIHRSNDPALPEENKTYSSYYDPKIDPDSKDYVYDSSDPKHYDFLYQNEYGLTEKQNKSLKDIPNGTGFWMTDGSIGDHAAQSTWHDMDGYMTKLTYRVFVNVGAKDVENVDDDDNINENTGYFKDRSFAGVITDEDDINYYNSEKDDNGHYKDENTSEDFIYAVLKTDGYYLYDNNVEWDEQKVCGYGQNSYYARLMHIWNDYETLLQDVTASY